MKRRAKGIVVALVALGVIALAFSIGWPHVWADRASVGPAAVERRVASFYRVHHYYPLSPTDPSFEKDYLERSRLRVEQVSGVKAVYSIASTRGRLADQKRYFRYTYLTTNTAPLIEELYLNRTNFVSFDR